MSTHLDDIREVLRQEAASIEAASRSVDAAYGELVAQILALEGKVVVTGIGKSGIVGRKIAATLTSTGTPAVFLHPAEAMHGDLGIVRPNDLVLVISKSGDGDELGALLPAIRRIGARVVALTGREDSTLARAADTVLPMRVEHEACPLDLAPTVSSTLALALGDAIAMAVMRARGFRPEDFALYHPGGKLGRRLLLKVHDLMIPLDRCRLLEAESASFDEVLSAMTRYGIGMVMFGEAGALDGILTDGDVRRLLARRREEVFAIHAADVMTRSPFTVRADAQAIEALEAMESHTPPLNVAPVLDDEQLVVGAVRLHDLLQVS
ncbi:MAG: KpsF/GutQ family sugar-phosphate isomerase [Burkholderiales bacterium]|nr:MAG: KpsF/GutQ family sugar-phosphate isomerase [Burkholderiales bacterium]